MPVIGPVTLDSDSDSCLDVWKYTTEPVGRFRRLHFRKNRPRLKPILRTGGTAEKPQTFVEISGNPTEASKRFTAFSTP